MTQTSSREVPPGLAFGATGPHWSGDDRVYISPDELPARIDVDYHVDGNVLTFQMGYRDPLPRKAKDTWGYTMPNEPSIEIALDDRRRVLWVRVKDLDVMSIDATRRLGPPLAGFARSVASKGHPFPAVGQAAISLLRSMLDELVGDLQAEIHKRRQREEREKGMREQGGGGGDRDPKRLSE
jgi:hypothetical protein